MRRNHRLEGTALLITTVFFLVVGAEEALAKGTVAISIAKGGTAPKVFIVTQNQKGEQVRVPVAAEGGKVDVPDGARLEIVNADRNAIIRVEGAVDVAVQGGSPSLQLSGDTMLTVSNAVQAMQVFVESGNPAMISQAGVTSLAAGQQMAIALTETGVNIQPMAVPPGVGMLTPGNSTPTGVLSGPSYGVAPATGSAPPQGLPQTTPIPGTTQGQPVTGAPGQPYGSQGFGVSGTQTMTPFMGMAQAGTAYNPTTAGTGLPAEDIALLNSISVPGMGTTSLNTYTYTPPPTTDPVLGDTITTAPDPFTAAGSTFVGTYTSGSTDGTVFTGTTTTDPTALTGTTSAEQFVADVADNTTTTTTTQTTCCASPDGSGGCLTWTTCPNP